jgi:hypothetical protein
MRDPLFGPAMTGPIDDPRASNLDPVELTAALFDERTRARLHRIAEETRYSPLELIREGTLRFLNSIESSGELPLPDSPQK